MSLLRVKPWRCAAIQICCGLNADLGGWLTSVCSALRTSAQIAATVGLPPFQADVATSSLPSLGLQLHPGAQLY